MTEHIPAWKRIGLQVKKELDNDPLALTTHISTDNITTKQIKKIEKQKRKLTEHKDNSTKKPPKRVKLPKADRPPPPEPDQLVYLKQFSNDRENWKFSKQKQNWIIKNIRTIPASYDSALNLYLDGLQGSSRLRLIETLKSICSRWNELAEIAEKNIEAQLAGKTDENSDKKQDKETEETKQKPQKKVSAKDEDPDYDYAVKCKKLIKLLTEEEVELKGIVEEDKTLEQEEKGEENDKNQQKEESDGGKSELENDRLQEDEEEEEEEENDEKIGQQEQHQHEQLGDSEITENLIIEEVNTDKFKGAKSVKIIDNFLDKEPTGSYKEEEKEEEGTTKSRSKKSKRDTKKKSKSSKKQSTH
jgi:hypothetical protein